MQNIYDVVVIGGGPAGLTAALYLARAKYRVIVVEKESFGGQITITNEVVNYPGVEQISGAELTEHMRRQAEHFGAEFSLTEVEKLELHSAIKVVHTNKGELHCFGVLLATGAHPRMIGFKGEEEFKGHGVAYCATCDGEFFTGKEVFVIGGGFAAAEEAVFLTRYARHVTILVREPDFTCAAATAEPAKQHEKITVLYNTEVEEVTGDRALRAIRYRHNETGKVSEYTADPGDSIGVFVFAGYAPATALVKGIADLNEQGYILTDRTLKTSVDGLYAAGDVCVKALRQVVTAVGDGALAATELERYAAAMQQKTGIIPQKPTVAPPIKEASTSHMAAPPDALFDNSAMAQLQTVFSRMEMALVLMLHINDSPLSDELCRYMEALAELTDKLHIKTVDSGEEIPYVQICHKDGSPTGLAFHGVPGGHEFSSFVLGLYNAAGPGQPLEADVLAAIEKIKTPVKIQVLVSLSCTMCPELVVAVQHIAALNAQVSAEIYDIQYFPALKEKYNVMSVPCLVVNDGEKSSFGKKSIRQVLEIINGK